MGYRKTETSSKKEKALSVMKVPFLLTMSKKFVDIMNHCYPLPE